MSKPFFFRIESADLLNFATDPEGEGMSLLRFAKELQKGESEIEFIQGIIDETVEFSQKKRDAAKSRWGDKKTPTTSRSQRLAAAREKGTHNKEEWLEMAAFFNQTCVKCEGEKQIGDIVKDHIIPIYQGGSDSISNLQPLCNSCNSSKGSDSTDHRLGKRLHNACKMPAQWLQTSASSSTVTEAVTVTEKPLNLCERDFIISQHKRIFARAISPAEFAKFGYLMQFSPDKVEKAFSAAKGKKSLNYVISILENDKPDKPKKGRLRK